MTWIFFALIGYFFGAVTNILDKFILSSRIPKPSVYAFFAAMFSVFSFVVAPFGLSAIHGSSLIAAILSGVTFVYGLLFFYKAVKVSEISRVAPLVGSLTAVGTLAIIILVSEVKLDISSGLSFWFLVIGGFLMAFDLPLKPRIMFHGIRTICVASLLFGISLALLKYAYVIEGFVNGYVWSRVGAVTGGLTLLVIPAWRREIFGSMRRSSLTQEESVKTGAWFVVNKVSGAASAFTINYAIFLGSLTLVHALAGIQYAFVFILVIVLSRWKPRFMQEHLAVNDWVQKIVALVCIAVGLYYASISATMIL